jgi:hypothetical protein
MFGRAQTHVSISSRCSSASPKARSQTVLLTARVQAQGRRASHRWRRGSRRKMEISDGGAECDVSWLFLRSCPWLSARPLKVRRSSVDGATVVGGVGSVGSRRVVEDRDSDQFQPRLKHGGEFRIDRAQYGSGVPIRAENKRPMPLITEGLQRGDRSTTSSPKEAAVDVDIPTILFELFTIGQSGR